jgi:hypothetical protein
MLCNALSLFPRAGPLCSLREGDAGNTTFIINFVLVTLCHQGTLSSAEKILIQHQIQKALLWHPLGSHRAVEEAVDYLKQVCTVMVL